MSGSRVGLKSTGRCQQWQVWHLGDISAVETGEVTWGGCAKAGPRPAALRGWVVEEGPARTEMDTVEHRTALWEGGSGWLWHSCCEV